MGQFLIVTNLTAESPALRGKVQEVMQADPEAEFMVLVPTYPVSAVVRFVAGLTTDRPVRLGRRRANRARLRLEAVSARVAAVRLVMREPLEAIEEELRYRSYSGVIVSTLPHPVSHWLRRDLLGCLRRRHPQLPVTHVIAPALLYEDEGSQAQLAGH